MPFSGCVRWTSNVCAMWVICFGFFGSSDHRAKCCWASEIPEIIQELVNRNHPPAIVRHRLDVPVYPANYDWDEEKRVRGAFARIMKSESEEWWQACVRNMDDDRYCLIWCQNGGQARKYTVGNVCGIVARRRLLIVGSVKSDPRSRDRADVHLKLGVDNLKNWISERPGKSLAALQAELLSRAVEQVWLHPKLKDEAKVYYSVRFERERQAIDLTQKPIVRTQTLELYDFINRENAEHIRKSVEDSK